MSKIAERAIAGLDWLKKQPTNLSRGDLVFVYGTLKRGFRNHRVVENARFVGEATTLEPWALPIYGGRHVPTVLPINEGYRIKGELYEPDVPEWRYLDKLEGHPHLYKRARVEVRLVGEDTPMNAWIYFFTSPMMGDLVPGRWAEEWNPKASSRLRDNRG